MLNPLRCLPALVLSVALLSAAAPTKAVPLEVQGDTVRVVRSFPVTVVAPPGGKDYTWLYPSTFDTEESDNTLKIKSAPKGSHKIRVKIVFQNDKKDLSFERGEVTVTVGDVPGPKPPDPVDPPVPAGAMRVLIVYETAELPNMKKDKDRHEQVDMLFDPKFKGALTDRTDKKGPNGRGWNIWDKDLNVTAADKFWQDAMARKHDTLPYVHVFKGDKSVYDGPLPKTQKEALDLINKYAGE